MSTVTDRISALERLLEEKDENLKKKIKMTGLIYGVLVLIVAIYTTWIIPEIKKMTSPEVAAELALAQISANIPQLRSAAVKQIRDNQDQWIAAIIEQVIQTIPQLEKPALVAFDQITDYLVQHVEHVLIPAFTAALKDNAVELKDRYQDFRDEEKMQGLALVFVEIFELEMDRYLNDKFIKEVYGLREKLRVLAEPTSELTKKELAQRKILVNWMYITETQQFGDTKVINFIDKLKSNFTSLLDIEDNVISDESIEGVDPDEI